MPRTKSSRKRQSRLEFTPLPSSSPASKHYNEQIRSRAAAVTIEDSPNPTRHARSLRDDDEDDDATLPTPGATAPDAAGDSDSEPVRTTQRRQDRSSPAPKSSSSSRRAKARQQQLDFTRARHPDTFDAPVKVASSHPASSGKGVFSSGGHSRMVELSSDSDSDLPSAKKVMARAKDKRRVEDKKGRITRSSQRPVVLSDSDQEGIVVASKKSPVEEASGAEDSGDDMPTTQGRMPRKRKRRTSDDDFISDSLPAAADSDDDVVEVRRPKRKRLQQASDEEEEEDEETHQSVKTPRRRLAKRSSQLSQREKEDLAEDLADLGSSSEARSSPGPPRSTQSAEKNARLKALEKLKRKRGRALEVVSEAPEGLSEGETGSQNDADAADDSEVEEVRPPLSSHQMFRADEGDEDFLVDEEEGDEDLLGIPDGIPLQYTRYASMKGKELFHFAISWMVQKKINPGPDMNAEIYDLTFRKLDDEVRGLASSKFTSSAWTADFTIALQARPEIAYHRSEIPLKDKCDACNRSQHPATYEVQFQKKPYSRDTLDPLDDQDESESSSSSSSNDGVNDSGALPDYDTLGREVLPENTIFYLGKFCMANAVTAHALSHWKYQLYDVVVTCLEQAGYLKPDKVLQRDKLSTKKRKKQARKIMKRMEDEGELRSLWKTFRDAIDDARNSKTRSRFGGDSP
ncbi:hypothetical protein CB0940_03437 [Cercospora beticola]|uniref:DUF4211 domain-containing protein n=1 Tax=Cercospora beticola TaxID=122368 RepID=A0A2G5I4M7_CERBT|nr:hypothetical protein CB0940_03437 [Cercospora beticola]PIA99764.1 hypothetical protein CB0940_03437 [Cercospora beticola]WPB00612.1 hypothetical protein RHO25_005232 [Cercospora beticola]CAK1361167.1 unnamed protein product [Cercospora beticola]